MKIATLTKIYSRMRTRGNKLVKVFFVISLSRLPPIKDKGSRKTQGETKRKWLEKEA